MIMHVTSLMTLQYPIILDHIIEALCMHVHALYKDNSQIGKHVPIMFCSSWILGLPRSVMALEYTAPKSGLTQVCCVDVAER